jgi:hypothetical protein
LTAAICDVIKICFACACITTLEVIALLRGRDGTMLRLSIAALAGLAGFSLAEFIKFTIR